MSIPPAVVNAARLGWNWQWNQLMNGLAPADQSGNYQRPPSQHLNAIAPSASLLKERSKKRLPRLIVGRSCPWAHRTWLVYQLRELHENLNLLIATADSKAGRWSINPPWLRCNSLLALYRLCETPPNHRATVPVLIDPGKTKTDKPQLMGNESSQLVEVLNHWPTDKNSLNLAPQNVQAEIENWQKLLQNSPLAIH